MQNGRMIDKCKFLGAVKLRTMIEKDEQASASVPELDLNAKLDLLFQKIDANDAKLNQKVDAIDDKLSALATKFDDLEKRVKVNEDHVSSLLSKQNKNESRLHGIDQKLQEFAGLIDANKVSCEFTSTKYDLMKDLPTELTSLKRENVKLKKTTDDLQQKLNVEKSARNIEQQYHRTSLNIKLCGVPLQDHEDEAFSVSNPVTLEAIKRVCSAASIIFDSQSVDVCHRLGESSEDRPSPIIIRFKTKNARFHFFSQKLKLKNITALDVDFTEITKDVFPGGPPRGGGNPVRGRRGGAASNGRSWDSREKKDGLTQVKLSPIYMQEHLTKLNKDLLKLAREKLQDKFAFPGYVKNGEVRAKLTEASKYEPITCEQDIHKLLVS